MSEKQNHPQNNRDQWQQRLLPFMVRMVGGLAVFFFIASLVQLVYLHSNIRNAPQVDFESLVQNEEQMEALPSQFRSLLILEANLVERRYHQANVFLMSRVWARYLGFVTGMILSLVGAVFILGRLQEDASTFKGETDKLKFFFQSNSPGLILAVLGVILMITTIITHHEIATAESPVYIQPATEKVMPLAEEMDEPIDHTFP